MSEPTMTMVVKKGSDYSIRYLFTMPYSEFKRDFDRNLESYGQYRVYDVDGRPVTFTERDNVKIEPYIW